ncbi:MULTISPECIES: protein YhfH [Paenibacillus]|uniref:Protein YhfH n=1 Tax=Paenibacillus oleatilyticus TaxID=2594886 RepID=A0ABV4V5Q6_9BACL|nr:protein YhfH [Paenibacillus tyrfis]GLI10050.1 hypothetical protein YDYSG_60830 [Paenibacillus tyrfis]
MFQSSTKFYEQLPAKCCSRCGETVEELADCYHTECYKCSETVFYPLSPIFLSMYNSAIQE